MSGSVLPVTIAEIPAFGGGPARKTRGGHGPGRASLEGHASLSPSAARARSASTRMLHDSRMIVRTPSGTLVRGASTQKLGATPPGRWWQSGGVLEATYDHKLVQGVLFFALFLALFLTDIWAASLVPSEHDVALYATLATVLALFLLDMVMQVGHRCCRC